MSSSALSNGPNGSAAASSPPSPAPPLAGPPRLRFPPSVPSSPAPPGSSPGRAKRRAPVDTASSGRVGWTCAPFTCAGQRTVAAGAGPSSPACRAPASAARARHCAQVLQRAGGRGRARHLGPEVVHEEFVVQRGGDQHAACVVEVEEHALVRRYHLTRPGIGQAGAARCSCCSRSTAAAGAVGAGLGPPVSTGGGTRRVQLVRGGDVTCPVSTGGTRRVQLVREGGGRGRAAPAGSAGGRRRCCGRPSRGSRCPCDPP